MKLSAQIAWEFDRFCVARGYQLHEAGGIKVDLARDGEISSNIDGCRARLRLNGRALEVRGTCREFGQNRECRHVWAALLTAEDQGLLPPPNEGRAFLAKTRTKAGVKIDKPTMRRPEPVLSTVPRPEPRRLWQNRTTALLRAAAEGAAPLKEWPANRVVLYSIRIINTSDHDLHLSVFFADPRKNGKGLTKPKPFNLNFRQLDQIPDATDRAIMKTLSGAREGNSYYSASSPISSWILHPELALEILPDMCGTGRCFIEGAGETDQPPLVWEDTPWHFALSVDAEKGQHRVSGIFVRGEQKKNVGDPILIVGSSLLFTFSTVAPIESEVPIEWLQNFRTNGPIVAPDDEWPDLSRSLVEARLPDRILPEELRVNEETMDPVPCLRIETRHLRYGDPLDSAHLSFDYGDSNLNYQDPRRGILLPEGKLLVRNREAEARARERLVQFKLDPAAPDPTANTGWIIPPHKLGPLVFQLTREKWRIDFRGQKIIQPSATSFDVTSGIDWFDLKASIRYGDHHYSYPQLLKAMEASGGPTIVLPDGSLGILPDEFLAEMGRLTAFGQREGDAVRFKLNQAGILDVLLAGRPETRVDETFSKARDRLKAFDGVRAAEQPAGFQGQLRDYQREGVGWMEFLREFGFGGCLADDMGVGKTAQVLALLETRRAARRDAGVALPPSIAVVPRSLVFNWKEEAARFTPALRILDHTTPDRSLDALDDHDVMIVTYGTLRRDIVKLSKIKFDYAILDEAQAIKNPASDSAKASRLLDADHRLALSGTPVQNSINDLWSLFEFLNPGMLGKSGGFRMASGTSTDPDQGTRGLLSRALRPLILRRTKEQVASELPPKVESILHCEMDTDQRKLYDELREHYRQSLLGAVDLHGIDRTKIMVLEALLRLRQAACHPGLIDKARSGEPSAKLDTLLARLIELTDEGHKALVFSQFTSFLDIVRQRLDKDGMKYEYLDGATRDRQAHVRNFEQDPDCKLFLISLKAGGVGLNLVSADYVFLLDPWWNPAVESQAIDRTHRIGQTRNVFAYRLIARDTVEEKVLELQDNKRLLADTVINQDNSLLAQMGRKELEYLLS